MSVAANIITVVHVLFVLWMLYAPFSKNPEVRVAFIVLTPFLWIHWILNDSTCALTLLEAKLRGLDGVSESFVHRIVAPVYQISDCTMQRVSWLVTIVLWIYAVRHTSYDEFRRLMP